MDLNGCFFHIHAVKHLKHDTCGQVSVFMKQRVKCLVPLLCYYSSGL